MSKHKAEQIANDERKPTEANEASAAAEPLPVPVPPAPLTEAEIADFKEKAEKAQQYYDLLLRTTADLENYKKRAQRERQEAVKFANESLLQKLITVLDNFDMAMAATNAGPATTAQALQAGVTMIHQQLKSVLGEAGLEEIDATQKVFDPNFHEAVAQQETSEVPEGHVVRQMRKGYKFRERLLRPATVIVAKPAPTEAGK